jgi:hypothetical protein
METQTRKLRPLIRSTAIAAALLLGIGGCSVMSTPEGYTVGGAAADGIIGDPSASARTNRNGPTGNSVYLP